MTTIAEAKASLVEAIEARGLTCVDHVPEEPNTPCAVLEGDDDYLGQGETYDPTDAWLNLKLHVLVDLVGNDQAAIDLDAALEKAIAGLGDTEWERAAMSKPQPVHTSEWLGYGANLTIHHLINLTTGDPA